MVVAPGVAPPVNVIDATPEALVNAVLDGVMVAIALLVVKVTTALGTAVPVASLTVAFTVVAVPLEMLLLASEIVKLGEALVDPGVPPVPPVPVVAVPPVEPEVQLTKTAIVMAHKNTVKNLVIF